MKIVVFAVLFVSVCCGVITIGGQEKGSKPAADKQGDESTATLLNQNTPQRENDESKEHSQGYFQRLFSPENLPNIGLFIAGVGGIIVAIYTLKSIKKQAELMDGQLVEMRGAGQQTSRMIEHAEAQAQAAKNAAEAAQKSADAARDSAIAMRASVDAMIKSERAWVMVDIQWQVGPRIFAGDSMVDGQVIQDTGIFVNFICRNEGKSFAQIIEKGYVLKIVSVLPQEPDFSDIDIFHYASEYIGAGAASEPYKLSGIQCQGRRKPDNMMVMYGRVKYRDIYGEHETRFGYIITGMGNLDRLPTSSYPEYNKHTEGQKAN